MSDLASLEFTEQSNVSKPVFMLHPRTLAKMDIQFDVVGRESDRVLHAKRRIEAKLNARAFEHYRSQQQAKEPIPLPPLSDEEIDDIETIEAAASVIGWRCIEENNVTVNYSEEDALRIFKKHPWMRRQVLRAQRDDELFFGGLPSNSTAGQSTNSDLTESTATEQPAASIWNKSRKPQRGNPQA